MNRLATTSMAAVALFGLSVGLSEERARAQERGLVQNQLVGTWTMVSWDEMRKDGTKLRPLWGANPSGLLMFDPEGRFSFQVISDITKIAANDRKKTTAMENKALAQGVFSYFGTYTVDNRHNGIVMHVERSTFPNMNGSDTKRLITSITANELKYTNPATLTGRQTYFVWKRAQPGKLSLIDARMR